MMAGTPPRHLLRLSAMTYHHPYPNDARTIDIGIDPRVMGTRAPTAMTPMTPRLSTTVWSDVATTSFALWILASASTTPKMSAARNVSFGGTKAPGCARMTTKATNLPFGRAHTDPCTCVACRTKNGQIATMKIYASHLQLRHLNPLYFPPRCPPTRLKHLNPLYFPPLRCPPPLVQLLVSKGSGTAGAVLTRPRLAPMATIQTKATICTIA